MKWVLSTFLLVEITLAFIGIFLAENEASNPLYSMLLVNAPILGFECLLLTLLLNGLVFSGITPRPVTRGQTWKSLVTVVLRDGCVFFVIVIILDVVDAVFQWKNEEIMRDVYLAFVVFLEAVLTPRIAASLLEARSGRNTVYLVPY